MAAEHRRPALRHGSKHPPMPAGQPRQVRLEKTIAVSAYDGGHLEGWPRHRRCFSRGRRAVSGTVELQGVQGTRDGLQMLLGEMEIQHRVPDLRVAEQQLNRPEVRCAPQKPQPAPSRAICRAVPIRSDAPPGYV